MGYIDVNGLRKIKARCEQEKRYAPDQFFLEQMMQGIKPIDRENVPITPTRKPKIKRKIK